MKFNSTTALIVGASFVTLVLAIVINMLLFGLSPNNLARVIKSDPYTFMEAVRVSGKKYQKIAQKKALAGEEDRIKEELKKPKDIATNNRVTFGPKKAPVTIVEFSDFQCPYCSKASARLKSIIKKYNGKVNVVYKNFPLSFHPFAEPAAQYFEAIAISDKSKARKFHDLIFDNFSDYARVKGDADIKKALGKLIKKVGISKVQVQKNLPQAKKIVSADVKEAEKLQIRGTPTFFVNGVNPGRKDLEDVIDLVLKK